MHLLCVLGGYKILIQDFMVTKYIIFIFLIHSDSVQKMLTALFI